MNLKDISDGRLVSEARSWVTKERDARTALLSYLLEIERRKLFSDYKCTSLFDFCVRILGYGESEAIRRIRAMRLVRDVPDCASMLALGSLSLTNASNAQSLFQRLEKAGREVDKFELLQKIEGKTRREADAILMELDPNAPERRSEGARSIGHGEFELKMIITEEMLNQMERLQGLLVHKKGALSYTEVFSLLLEEGLKKHAPKEVTRALKSPAPEKVGIPGKRIHIPLSVQREIYKKAGGKCSNCRSYFALENDHVHLLAFGGGNESENLRLLCRNCNQRAALRFFSPERTYLRKDRD